MNQIVPFDTWGRSHQPGGGKSKWHLIIELRRSNAATFAHPAGTLFAVTMCAQALPDPEWGPAEKPRPRWRAMPAPIIPGTGTVCSSCADLADFMVGSSPA